MPPLLRSKSTLCHYCNRWSRNRNKGSRHFQCDNCLADNFLDEHGELADVPPESTSSPSHGAQRFATALSSDQQEQISNPTIFCSTCLKNQHLLNETLANYLPPADDPDYAYYEASYPEFRRNLEERYPPVCSSCEPGAMQQIEQARHTAKSDHLRRMMECSRQSKVGNRWGWRRLVIGAGSFFFWMSFLGQLAWHFINIVEEDRQTYGVKTASTRPQLLQCLYGSSMRGKVELGCADVFAPVASWAIFCGFLSCWWNPYWSYKLQGQQGRLKGLREYYQTSAAVLLMRLGFWTWGSSSVLRNSTGAGQKVIHTLALIMMLIFTAYTLTRITIDTTPLVFWQKNFPALLSPAQYGSSGTHKVNPQAHLSQNCGSRNFTTEKFPVSRLVPEAPCQIWQSPTPPPEDDADAMEWEPSYTFHPKPDFRISNVAPRAGPSPFHGALPPKPTNRLLHPKPWLQPTEKRPIGLSPGIFDNRDRLKAADKSEALPPIAEPKFFSQQDRDADTGLESIFDKVFSMDDAPIIPEGRGVQSVDRPRQQKAPQSLDLSIDTDARMKRPWLLSSKLDVRHAVKLSCFGVCLVIWYAARALQLNMHEIELSIVCLVALISVGLALWDSKNLISPPIITHVMPSGLLILGSTFLAYHIYRRGGSEAGSSEEQSVLIFLYICCCWELPRLVSQDSSQGAVNGISSSPPAAETNVAAHHIRDALEAGESGTRIAESSGDVRHAPSLQGEQPNVRSRQFQPRQFFPLSPAASSQQPQRSTLLRLRSDSIDSVSSQSSNETSTTATTAGEQTPNFRGSYSSAVACKDPGANLRTLAQVDASPSYSRQAQDPFGLRSRRMI